MNRGVFFALATFALTGCGSPETKVERAASSAAVTPVRGDWIVVRYEAEPDVLNRMLSSSAYTDYAVYGSNSSQVFETLLQLDTRTWQVTRPLLASAYPEISEDHKTYTFAIRNGVQWHDGRPFTAADVIFSAKAIVCPGVDSGSIRGVLSDMADVELLADGRVRFTVKQDNYLNGDHFGQDLPILSKAVFDPDGILDGYTLAEILGPRRNDPRLKAFGESFNKHPSNRSPVGTGPYKFVSWEPGKELVLERNDSYWGTKPNLDRIIFRFITDAAAGVAALRSGDIDLNPRIAPQVLDSIQGPEFERDFVRAEYTIAQYYWLGWNPDRPFFADKKVRRALTHLVPRQQIIDNARRGLGTIAESYFFPGSPYFNASLKPLPYDPKRAAELLEEAGWTDHNGNGIRDKNGQEFRFELLGPSGSTFFDQAAAVIRDEFKRAGIEVTDRRLDFNVWAANMRSHKFDATAGAWTLGLNSDPYGLWHSDSIPNGGQNWLSYRNRESDRLIEAARREFDAEKRKQLYLKWQEIIYDDQPVTFLFYPRDTAAYSRRFHNVQWLPARPGYDLNSWFVPLDQQKHRTSGSR